MKITKEQELFQKVVQTAWENDSFKQALISSPIATIEKLTGGKVNLPEGKTLVVRDQTNESTVYINIPAEQNMEDVELTEEQLEAVAGGKRIPVKIPILIIDLPNDYETPPFVPVGYDWGNNSSI